ncbi:hypothetical protein AVME950_03595 [Acidovorax sp. SUPP950]|uniref:hypothetical protein n=1 Tax=Acidovorax sp. SUPP950 TaxID=511901 RepID=UPI0023CA6A93|nr:hypothetical protein [Acidovorax sp. SUPP950]GKS73937.1 hypothetical protein AVME950_03595 [Acidovorax sp. SUPP950]
MLLLSPVFKSGAFVTAGLALLAALSTTPVLAQSGQTITASGLGPNTTSPTRRQVRDATFFDAQQKCRTGPFPAQPVQMLGIGVAPTVQNGQRLFFAEWRCG